MTKSTAVKNKPRNQHTPEFREQALALADTDPRINAAHNCELPRINSSLELTPPMRENCRDGLPGGKSSRP
jgi:hypothetical protein